MLPGHCQEVNVVEVALLMPGNMIVTWVSECSVGVEAGA